MIPVLICGGVCVCVCLGFNLTSFEQSMLPSCVHVLNYTSFNSGVSEGETAAGFPTGLLQDKTSGLKYFGACRLE